MVRHYPQLYLNTIGPRTNPAKLSIVVDFKESTNAMMQIVLFTKSYFASNQLTENKILIFCIFQKVFII
jgi:hypothetical protein